MNTPRATARTALAGTAATTTMITAGLTVTGPAVTSVDAYLASRSSR